MSKLTPDEQFASVIFDELLDEGWVPQWIVRCVEAANETIRQTHIQDADLYDWLAKDYMTALESMYENLLISSVEGGSDWFQVSSYSYESGDVRVTIHPAYEEDEFTVTKITVDDIRKAVRQIANNKETYPDNLGWTRDIRDAIKNPENEDVDGIGADCVMQVAALGEIVYG